MKSWLGAVFSTVVAIYLIFYSDTPLSIIIIQCLSCAWFWDTHDERSTYL